MIGIIIYYICYCILNFCIVGSTFSIAPYNYCTLSLIQTHFFTGCVVGGGGAKKEIIPIPGFLRFHNSPSWFLLVFLLDYLLLHSQFNIGLDHCINLTVTLYIYYYIWKKIHNILYKTAPVKYWTPFYGAR